jgi:hypothetical protein
MIFIETSVFTRQALTLLPDDELRKLQLFLAEEPESGSVIRSSGGLRKIRWAIAGQGKRGGVRIIYYWAKKRDQLFLLLIYAKNEQTDLTPEQIKRLRKILEEPSL